MLILPGRQFINGQYNKNNNNNNTTSVAMETLRPINSQELEFLRDLGRRISQVSNDVRENAFLFQRLSVLI